MYILSAREPSQGLARARDIGYVVQPPDFLLALYKEGREPQHSLPNDNIIVKLSYCFLSFIIISHCQLVYIATPNHELKGILKVLLLQLIYKNIELEVFNKYKKNLLKFLYLKSQH